jgi:hypothetical protein
MPAQRILLSAGGAKALPKDHSGGPVMKLLRLAGIISLVWLGAGMALAQKVNVDFDKTANFTGFKTYAWVPGTPAKNPLMATRITSAIEAQLAAKGLQKVEDPSTADLNVIYHAATDVEERINTYGSGGWYGPGYGWGYGGGGMSTTTVDRVPVGELIVDIGDVKNKKLIWQGKASGTLSDKPEKVEKTINNAVEDMFKKFPPEIKN